MTSRLFSKARYQVRDLNLISEFIIRYENDKGFGTVKALFVWSEQVRKKLKPVKKSLTVEATKCKKHLVLREGLTKTSRLFSEARYEVCDLHLIS